MISNPKFMKRFTLDFVDADMEAEFAGVQAKKSQHTVRIALIWATLLFFSGWVFSIAQPHQVPAGINLQLLGTPILFLPLVYAATYLPIFLRRHQPSVAVSSFAGSLIVIAVITVLPFETMAARGFFFMAMHLISIYCLFGLRFPMAVVTGLLSIVTYLAYFLEIGWLDGRILGLHAGYLAMANLWGMVICYQMDLATRREFLATREAQAERAHSDRLLLNILPRAIIEELNTRGEVEPRRHEEASILFTDFSGFTQAVSTMPAKHLVQELDQIFRGFDEIIVAHGLEKIKTIGDAYMAACGLPLPADDHAQRCARAALALTHFITERNQTAAMKWGLRVGVHSGAVVAGIVGKNKYAYDVWGDTVNIASRLESAGEVNKVNVSAYTFGLIRDQFHCEYRGKLPAKGKGDIDMYFVLSENKPGEVLPATA